MKLPITKYGLPQVVLFPVILGGLGVLAILLLKPGWPLYLVTGIIAILLVFTLAFFRDPPRNIIQDDKVLLSPADGTITDISELSDSPLGVPSKRIGIFLSVFNVHINRSPCRAKVTRIEYRKGEFRNAMSPESGKVNESNDLYLERVSPPLGTVLVRQISGAIARRIVCMVKEGDTVEQGERFGMIKFGSRTELYIPIHENLTLEAKVGQKVKAGLTSLARYK
ncbi:MAG: phosphatidylserine decarboxylase [Spirochaetales bacterium]